MLDNLLNTVKRGAEKVQRRGEEVAQVARLKMEVFQLNRELDGHYARLGRSYHAGAETDLLAGIQADVRRVEDDIQARERLIEELGGTPDDDAEQTPDSGTVVPVTGTAMPMPDPREGEARPASVPSGGSTLPTPTPGGPFPEAPTPPHQGPTGNTPPFVDGTAEDDSTRR